MKSGPVAAFCAGLAEARRRGGGIDDQHGRQLALAVADQVRMDASYCPEQDRRVLWAREVIASAWRGDPVPRAPLRLEAAVECLLEPCGKFLAAGGDR